MKSNQPRGSRQNFILSLSLGTLAVLFPQQSVIAEPPASTGDEIKHIHVPFVHIDIKKHADGTKDVDVKAPFTNVHNPTGTNNAQVKAPFYKSNNSPVNTVSNTNNK